MMLSRETLSHSSDGTKVLGWLIYYTTSNFSIPYSDLVDKLKEADIDPSIARETASRWAFQRAVNEYKDSSDKIVKRQEGETETAAVLASVTTANTENGYSASFTTEAIPVFDKKEKVVKSDGGLAGFDRHYTHHKKMYGGHQFRVITLRYLKRYCNALTVMDTGGLYFVPYSREAEMRKLERLYEIVHQDAHITPIPVRDDEEVRQPMWQKMCEEVTQEISDLKRDFDNLDDAIADRVRTTRLRRYASLRGKVELYEAALESTASTLKDELNSLEKMVREKAVAL